MIDFSTLNLFCLKVSFIHPVREEAKSRAGDIILDALDIYWIVLIFHFCKKAMELSEILYNKAEYIETVI